VKEHIFLERLRGADPVGRTGRIRRIFPTYVEADGPGVPLGTLCEIEARSPPRHEPGGSVLAEVVSVNRDAVVLVPFDEQLSTFPGATVSACSDAHAAPVGDVFLGRAVDALGRPIDGRPIRTREYRPHSRAGTSPLARTSPKIILETGVRAIDGLLTLGQGQRIGVFAASGVGKTSLMSQLARQIDADCCVICLVGERVLRGAFPL